MKKFALIMIFVSCISTVFATDAEDAELLSDKVVSYFKRVSSETGKPISLKITLTDTFGSGASLEDEKNLDPNSLPRGVSRSFVIDILRGLGSLLDDFLDGKDPQTVSLNATMWINAPNHREKVNGFCTLGLR